MSAAGAASAASAATGRALCIGVDADADASRFAALAVERGFVEPTLLLGERASRAVVRAKLLEMAALSEPGDLFLLTFCGHGGRTCVRRVSGELHEVATWQLYDGTLNDEQLRTDLACFRRGVRVLVVSDNCGGGMPQSESPQSPGGSEEDARLPSPGALEEDTFLSRPAIEGFLKASVLVLAACQDAKYADGPGLPGHFAEALMRTLNGNGSNGSHGAFHKALCSEMPSYQKPDYYRLGIADAAFEAQQPFTI